MRHGSIDHRLELFLSLCFVIHDILGNINHLKHIFVHEAVVERLSLDLVVPLHYIRRLFRVVILHIHRINKLLVLIENKDGLL